LEWEVLAAKLDFFLNNEGYLYFSNYGEVLKSVNGGVIFSAMTNPNEVYVASMPDFINSQDGFAIFKNGDNESLMYTTDGGKGWTQIIDTSYLKLVLGN
jgi:photosystem II stability/assembly factor-like uncharacterized protein